MQKSPEYDMIEIIAGLFCWRHRREDTQTMIYVTSDIHGDYIHFSQMTEKIGLSSEDRLYVLGDAVDKGKENLRVLRHIYCSENICLIKGNHEYLFEKYLQGTISAELWDACGGSVTRAEVLSYNIQLQTSVKAPCQFREYAEEWGPKYLQYADSI